MLAIVGPTASGKSDIANFLVNHYDFSVINFDSCQFYKKISVLTAVPSNLKEHYLYSFASFYERLNVVKWAELATELVKDFNSKKKPFVFVGGTGLYLKAFIEGMDYLPKNSDFAENFVAKLSLEETKSLLKEKDPIVLTRYFDERRLKKALMFFISHEYSLLDAYGKFRHNFHNEKIEVCALIPEKNILHERIHARLYKYFDLMVAEVENLNFEADFIIGFSEIKKLINGQISKEECLRLIEIRTRQYAKRQVTFIKNSLKIDRFFTNSEQIMAYFMQKYS